MRFEGSHLLSRPKPRRRARLALGSQHQCLVPVAVDRRRWERGLRIVSKEKRRKKEEKEQNETAKETAAGESCSR